jgi:hypothetical protein
MEYPGANDETVLMRSTVLFPLMAVGLFALAVPSWADAAPVAAPFSPGNVSLLPDPVIDAGSVSPVPPAEAVATATDLSTDDFIDTIPLMSLDLPTVVSPVRIELMLEESVVGLDSVDGVGVMVSW